MRASLSRKLLYINATLLIALAGLGAALAWGVTSLRDAVASTADEYAELRLIEEALYHASTAASCFEPPTLNLSAADDNIASALARLDEFLKFQSQEHLAEDEHQRSEFRHYLEARDALEKLHESVQLQQAAASPDQDQAQRAQIERARFHLSRLAAQTDIAAVRTAAADRTAKTLLVIGSLCGLLICGAIATIAICYWSVLRPVRRIHAGVRRIASGHFAERLEEGGSREFAELAADFNRMATELEALYGNLERKVQKASRELVQSERLASVGFLAAGVAHEINNPLHIMSGHAELALRALRSGNVKNNHEVEAALNVICEEAFRCKAITEKLLSLSRVSDGQRTDIKLPQLIRDVIEMLRGLAKYRTRRLSMQCDESALATVHGNPAEIKQVLLNLTVNALEAVDPKTGEVVVEAARRNGSVEVIVRDNGCGMSPEVLEHAFEPFYSARGNGATRGTGLGLSISHAIVQNHGGRITAASEGEGLGSRFTIELPVAKETHGAN